MSRSRRLAIGLGGFLLLSALVSFRATPGYALSTFADSTSVALILLAVSGMIRSAFLSHGRIRVFWLAMASGAALASINLGAWFYYEIIARRAVPEPFWADIPLFLAPIPMIAAAALGPHRKHQGPKFDLAALNFLILLLWWVCLYTFLVLPNEYISWNSELFNRYYDFLYDIEFVMLLIVLGAMSLSAKGPWRKFYWHFFLASALYVFAYQALNSALVRGRYYTGSIYDVPDNAATCWFIWIAFTFHQLKAEEEPDRKKPVYARVLLTGATALAVLSLPVAGLCVLFFDHESVDLQHFRLAVTLGAVCVLGLCGFLRQMLVERELVCLLGSSQQSLDNLQRLQTELVQKEKLASLGKLAAGAAHEINNPLAAILGYSELLSRNDSVAPEQLSAVRKIGQQARRVRDLVSNLLKFAQQTSADKSLVDLGSLVTMAMQTEGVRTQSKRIQIETHIEPALPCIWGNTNQLFQACLQVIGNALDALEDAGGGTLTIAARRQADELVLEFSDTGSGIEEPEKVFDPFYTTKPLGKGTGLGLSATYGVVENHGGNISCHNKPQGGAVFVLRFPVANGHAARLNEAPIRHQTTDSADEA